MRGSLKGLARLLGYLRGHAFQFSLGVVLVLLMSYTNGVVPNLIRKAIDMGVTAGDYGQALHYALLILLAGVLNGVFSFAGRYLLVKSAQHAVYRLRMDAFRAIQRQRMEFLIKPSPAS